MLNVERIKRSYRDAIHKVGTTVDVLSNTGSGFDEFEGIPALVRGYTPDELVGEIELGDVRVVILAEDMPEGLKIKTQSDRIRVNGEVYGIAAADPNTRAVAGVTIAWEIRAKG